MWAGVRWRPIIKVVTNTSDSIKSELIVIKRNGVSAGEPPPLARRFFASEIIDGWIFRFGFIRRCVALCEKKGLEAKKKQLISTRPKMTLEILN
jgi:hypothetical protein